MGSTRRRPSTRVQVGLLVDQDNRCLYCGHRFGDLVVRKGNDWVWLEVAWDHFVPYAYSEANPDDGWVAACQLCNAYKSDLIFVGVVDVRRHVMDRAIANEHDPLPFWSTDPTTPPSEIVPPRTLPATVGDEVEIAADVSLVVDPDEDDDEDEYIPGPVEWRAYEPCSRCGAATGSACPGLRTGRELNNPHPGRRVRSAWVGRTRRPVDTTKT